jgi:hypothetical protein
MKLPLYNWTCLGAVVLSFAACQTTLRPRVVRLALNPDSSSWRLRVNQGDVENSISGSELTNKLTRLHMHQGDVILVNSPTTGKSGSVRLTEEWISGYCQSNQVAVYLVHTLPEIDMFSVQAYHWSAPHDNPFDLSKASFFYEGKFLENGREGFEAMLQQITTERPQQIFILGSMYDFNRSFPPDPNPYEASLDRLGKVLNAAGTDWIQLETLPGF